MFHKKTALLFSLFIAGSSAFADGFFIQGGGGIAQNSGTNTAVQTESRPGVKTVQLNQINLNDLTPLWSIGGGYEWTWNHWTVAPGVTFDQTTTRVTQSPALQPTPIPIANSYTSNINASNIFLNAKVSYAFFKPWSVFFLTGVGRSFLSTNSTFNFDYSPLPASDNQKNNVENMVWQVGGGIDYTLTPQWTINTTLLYRDYGNVPSGSFYVNPPVTTGFPISYSNYSAVLFTINIVFHFVSLVS